MEQVTLHICDEIINRKEETIEQESRKRRLKTESIERWGLYMRNGTRWTGIRFEKTILQSRSRRENRRQNGRYYSSISKRAVDQRPRWMTRTVLCRTRSNARSKSLGTLGGCRIGNESYVLKILRSAGTPKPFDIDVVVDTTQRRHDFDSKWLKYAVTAKLSLRQANVSLTCPCPALLTRPDWFFHLRSKSTDQTISLDGKTPVPPFHSFVRPVVAIDKWEQRWDGSTEENLTYDFLPFPSPTPSVPVWGEFSKLSESGPTLRWTARDHKYEVFREIRKSRKDAVPGSFFYFSILRCLTWTVK